MRPKRVGVSMHSQIAGGSQILERTPVGTFAIGDRVTVVGLKNNQGHNGKLARVVGIDDKRVKVTPQWV